MEELPWQLRIADAERSRDGKGNNIMSAQGQIVIFEAEKNIVQVRLDGETVWLTLQQLADLFQRDKSVVAKNATTAADGKTYQVEYFNLDVIISVGYRVNSARATQFRQWATRILKQHLVQGYTLNQHRLKERGIAFEQVLALLSSTLVNQQLVKPEGSNVLAVISDYARTWSLLQGYDEQSLAEQSLKQHNMLPLDLDEVLKAIVQLKNELMAKGEATELFGQVRGDGLASAIATIEQGFGDELFYPNIASRAAHLLYFVIKNHPFADGNKRSGSFLFLWYLRINQHLLAKPIEHLINDNTLVALALLVAESKPQQKDLMIRLIEHFILLREATQPG
jgi:prophage maintenance system killer protein/prophage antirepressor-like protein